MPRHAIAPNRRSETSFDEEYRLANPRSEKLYRRERGTVPGGSTRGATFFQPFPLYAADANGYRLTDVDGHERVDFMNNFSALVFGHRDPRVTTAVARQLEHSAVYGAPSAGEVELAELIVERLPSVERVIFTTTGSEAVLVALRGARALTGRTLIGKFEGGYHGSYDWVKVSSKPAPEHAGPRVRPHPVADSEGIPPTVVNEVCVMTFNDVASVEATLEEYGDRMAAVIVEPVLGSGGMIPAEPPFLQHLRAATRDREVLLVFDEIITQRLGPGGAQATYDVMPDMTLLAKGIGGGFPIGAVGGPEYVMGVFDNSDLHPQVYHSGTFNANAVSVAAGLATLRGLTPDTYRRLNRLGELCRERLNELFGAVDAPVQATGLGSLFNFHATTVQISGYRDVRTEDAALQHSLFLGLLNSGIYCAPRGMGCVSTPMGHDQVDALLAAMAKVLGALGYR